MMQNTHVRVEMENTTAISYINEMGGSKARLCNTLARRIWLWCKERSIWLSAVHIPGILNTEADAESRVFPDETEWKLDPNIFHQICSKLMQPNVDLFASRLNHQLDCYAAWRPDPSAQFIDAFTMNWHKFKIYAFPPFSLIPRVLQKMLENKGEGVVIVPLWPTQAWWPRMLRMMVENPLLLPRTPTLLTLPYKNALHPLRDKLTLVACHLSGQSCKTEDFQRQLPVLSWEVGENLQENSMIHTSRNGRFSVLEDRLICFHQL